VGQGAGAPSVQNLAPSAPVEAPINRRGHSFAATGGEVAPALEVATLSPVSTTRVHGPS